MMKKLYFAIFFGLFFWCSLGQSSLFEKLTMITMDDGKVLLNTDGYEISAEILEMGFQSEEFKRFQTENDIAEKSKRQNPLLSYRPLAGARLWLVSFYLGTSETLAPAGGGGI